MNPSVFFNSHHSPIGAFSSFTLGMNGMRGGLGMELTGPANQNVYIGLESRDKNSFELLPFFEQAENIRNRFVSEINRDNDESDSQISLFDTSKIERTFSLCSDTWKAGDLTFTIHTPILPIPDPQNGGSEPELKQAIVPAVFAELTIDNSNVDTCRKAVLGFQGNDRQSSMRRIDDTTNNKITGIGQGRYCSICSSDTDIVSGLAFTIDEILYPKQPENMLFGLGTVGGLIMTAKPRTIRTWKFAVCFYKGGIVTAGIDTSYYYTKYYKNIEEVAQYSLENFDFYKEKSLETNRKIEKAALSHERNFMFSYAVKSYYGNTQLMCKDGEPVWLVNEGEYRMINTFDLTVDHLFFELTTNPWTIRNALDIYTEKYCYYDSVHAPDSAELHKGGIAFTHDIGVANTFSRPQYSVYELPNHTGCFSYMSQEQLTNWILCGAVYYFNTSDTKWLQKQSSIFKDCFESMLNRDHFDPSQRDGVMDFDSSRTGSGSEITTYDNVDRALGQAHRNTYLAVKCWASYVALNKIFLELNDTALAKQAQESASLCEKTIFESVNADGTIPGILESGNKSVTLSVVEGLIYAWKIDKTLVSLNGPYAKLTNALKRHCEAVLLSGACLFEDSGWRLSSTSDNSWISKIILCQFIIEEILGIKTDHNADKVHMGWLLNPQNSYYAWCDQMAKGLVCGSRYYPRGVTSVLWVENA